MSISVKSSIIAKDTSRMTKDISTEERFDWQRETTVFIEVGTDSTLCGCS